MFYFYLSSFLKTPNLDALLGQSVFGVSELTSRITDHNQISMTPQSTCFFLAFTMWVGPHTLTRRAHLLTAGPPSKESHVSLFFQKTHMIPQFLAVNRCKNLDPKLQNPRQSIIQFIHSCIPVSYTHLTLPTNREV